MLLLALAAVPATRAVIMSAQQTGYARFQVGYTGSVNDITLQGEYGETIAHTRYGNTFKVADSDAINVVAVHQSTVCTGMPATCTNGCDTGTCTVVAITNWYSAFSDAIAFGGAANSGIYCENEQELLMPSDGAAQPSMIMTAARQLVFSYFLRHHHDLSASHGCSAPMPAMSGWSDERARRLVAGVTIGAAFFAAAAAAALLCRRLRRLHRRRCSGGACEAEARSSSSRHRQNWWWRPCHGAGVASRTALLLRLLLLLLLPGGGVGRSGNGRFAVGQ